MSSALNNPSVKNTLENNLERKIETGLVQDEALLLNKNRGLNNQNVGLSNQGLGLNQGLNTGNVYNNLATSVLPANLASTGVSNTTYVQSGQRSSLGLVRSEPTVVETIQKGTVVREHIHPVQKEEIQPIIYREREQLDVKQITQVLHETQIQPTVLEHRELPAQRREAVIERAAPITSNLILPSSETHATTVTQQINAPIINETIKRTVLEEIQPVLERDVYQSTIIQNVQPIHEKIIEAPRVTREVRSDNTRRISQGFTQEQIYNAQQGGVYNETLTSSLTGQRLSGSFTQEQIYNAQPLQQGAVYNETLLTNRGLQTAGAQNIPLTQGQGQIYNAKRFSQGYTQGQVYNAQPLQQGQIYNAQPLQGAVYSEPIQNRRLSQNFGQNIGLPPAAGMNNTGLGLASAVPLNTAAPQVGPNMVRGFNEQPNVYNEGYRANNLVTSVGLNGVHSVAGSVNSTTGNSLYRASNMTPVSVMEQGLVNNQSLSQGYPVGLTGEKLRDYERQQALLRQQTPAGFQTL